MMLMFPEQGRQLAAASVRGWVDQPPSYVFPDGVISLLPGDNIRRIAALANMVAFPETVVHGRPFAGRRKVLVANRI